MELSELAIMTARLTFGRRKAAFEKFKVAFERHLESEDSLALQLEMEECFHKAYKKKASTKLIRKMASLPMGPYEAFDIYSLSSPAIGCDYNTHTIRTPTKMANKKVAALAKTFGYILLVSISLFLFSCSIYIATETTKDVLSFSKKEFMEVDFGGVFMYLLRSLFGIIAFASGVLTFWGGLKLVLYERTEAALRMAKDINSHDHSS